MSQVAYKEAKERLGSLMSQAAKGEEVIIEGEDGCLPNHSSAPASPPHQQRIFISISESPF